MYDHVCEVAVELPDTGTILTALGLVATGVVWAVERFLPGRKRIGYRVQLDTAIGMNPRAAHDIVQLRVLWSDQEVTDATLALLRVENDGSKDIVRHDYQEPLTVEFPGRTIVGVEVTETSSALRTILTRNGGLRPEGGRLVLPRVPLNRRDHFKLLVLLTGNGNQVTMDGFLSGGSIRLNAARRGPRKSSLVLGGVFIILMGLLGGLLLSNSNEGANDPVCASGELTIDGSTAFAPPMRAIAKDYQKQCPGADIEVRDNGSLNGLKNLSRAGQETPDPVPAFIAMSDVRAPGIKLYEELTEHPPVSVIPLSVTANHENGVDNLTTDQLRNIYSGKYTNWTQVGGSNLPISLVTRDSQSGTRITFEKEVLKGMRSGKLAGLSDCTTRANQPSTHPQHCEAADTESALETVGKVPGAIGYAETYSAGTSRNVVSVRLDGEAPVLTLDKPQSYPFWATERLYTYGEPKDGSLTAKFLTFMNSDTAQTQMGTHKHLPCSEAKSFYSRACAL
ncbi:substrate-binding domain-containing protein [Streptomyces zagrosensis]|uniref:ABC-type phosphate transport system substrate-binding protein n=1 Tax=Streptomyces zagrosensis TaxID=1042984 RepID=A0A7W9UW73_9ACTN|nr:substrate-binding domain-containing protein [Streptomyces zagrosensis]MBB5933016.1 ABC-type phosphate transport system substrate-binding protein [Streptomyces zagrosensis]